MATRGVPMSPRWRKIMRDLTSHWFRTALVVLSIAIGIFALVVLGSLTEADSLISAKPEEQPLENTDLAAFCRNIVEAANDFTRASDKSLQFHCAEDCLVAAVRCSHIERLLLNLISNALKFTPSGGLVSVTLALENGLALLTVSDQGEGLEPGEMATAFSHFEAGLEPVAKPKGLGIGLSLVRHIAVSHGGSVMLESRPEKGTNVIVSLPVSRLEDNELHSYRPPVDYSGGFSNILVELSDALPPEAFLPQNLD
jgi:signal transduction histidine kinase